MEFPDPRLRRCLPSFGPSRPHEVASPELPTSRSPAFPIWSVAITGAEPEGSICSIMHFVGSPSRPSRRKISDFGRFSPGRGCPNSRTGVAGPSMGAQKSTAPLKRNMLAWRRRPKPRVMQCPRHQFVWPECKRFNAADANFLKGIRALKRGLAADVSVARAGLVLQIFPVVSDLAA